jgi:hypothetical protein
MHFAMRFFPARFVLVAVPVAVSSAGRAWVERSVRRIGEARVAGLLDDAVKRLSSPR